MHIRIWAKERYLKQIHDFFGSIKKDRVIEVFKKIGYPEKISIVLAELCCLYDALPQGAPTSPALSNIISYEMDKQIADLAYKNHLIYTRYADDITLSGDNIDKKTVTSEITDILDEESLWLNQSKTQLKTEKSRKIITGVSISSGKKLTIPKAKKRELRKNIHFILTKGLAEHQKFIGSKDPAYLKRIIGYLNFWKSIEPDNSYVLESLARLKKLVK